MSAVPLPARPSRRTFVAGLAAVALFATGCGGDVEEEVDGGASSGGVFPVQVEHAFGTTTVEAEPKRVVTAGYTEQDTVLALGIKPVGVTDWYGDQPNAVWPWAQEALGDAKPEVLNSADGLQFEKIAALRPDLIIATNAGLEKADYEKLSAIAPTIAHSGDHTVYFEPWDVQALAAGKALGRESEIKTVVEGVKKQFADAAAAHPEFEGKNAIFLQNAFYDGSAIAYQDGLSTDFLTDLGFVVPKSLDQYSSDDSGQAYIPLERLSVLDDGDVLLWATEKPEDRAALAKEKLYTQLARVKDGHEVFTDGETAGAIYFTTVLSLPHVLEKLVPAFAATLEGKGAQTVTS